MVDYRQQEQPLPTRAEMTESSMSDLLYMVRTLNPSPG